MFQYKHLAQVGMLCLIACFLLSPLSSIAQDMSKPSVCAIEKAKKITQQLYDGKRKGSNITKARQLRGNDPEYLDIMDALDLLDTMSRTGVRNCIAKVKHIMLDPTLGSDCARYDPNTDTLRINPRKLPCHESPLMQYTRLLTRKWVLKNLINLAGSLYHECFHRQVYMGDTTVITSEGTDSEEVEAHTGEFNLFESLFRWAWMEFTIDGDLMEVLLSLMDQSIGAVEMYKPSKEYVDKLKAKMNERKRQFDEECPYEVRIRYYYVCNGKRENSSLMRRYFRAYKAHREKVRNLRFEQLKNMTVKTKKGQKKYVLDSVKVDGNPANIEYRNGKPGVVIRYRGVRMIEITYRCVETISMKLESPGKPIGTGAEDFELASEAETEGENGVFIEAGVKTTEILDKRGLLGGVRIGLIKNHRFSIGIGGYTAISDFEVPVEEFEEIPFGEIRVDEIFPEELEGFPTANDRYLDISYGGLVLEYTLAPALPIHLSFNTLIGIGGVNYREDKLDLPELNLSDTDRIWVAEPGVNLILKPTKHLQLTLGASYRFIRDVELVGVEDEDLSKPSVSLSLRLGWF